MPRPSHEDEPQSTKPGAKRRRRGPAARSSVLRSGGRGLLLAALASIGVTQSLAAADPQAVDRVEAELWQLVPQLIRLSTLASYDPALAAGLIPESWVESAVLGALSISAERAETRLDADEPQSWPLGPWPTQADLVASIDSIPPTAARDLYRALRPRIAQRCRGARLSFEQCEQRFRVAADRLAAPALAARIAGNVAIPITPTQREIVALGPEVVSSFERKLDAVRPLLFPTSPAPVAAAPPAVRRDAAD